MIPLQMWHDNPWALATTIFSVCAAFVLFILREAIKEALIGSVKSRRERAKRIAELENLFNAGEREMLAGLAKTGGYLIVSTRERMDGNKRPVRLVDLTKEWRLATASFDDLLALYRRGLLDGDGGHATRSTDNGKVAGEEVLRVFGVPEALSGPTSKEQ